MAFLTSKQISDVAVQLLGRQLVLPMTGLRIPDSSFAPAAGMTTTVQVPAYATAREQENPGDTITYDDLTTVGVDVTLSHLYHATKITDEDLTFSIQDFSRQVLRPQVEAVARGAEDALATPMNALPADDTVAADGSDVDAAIMAARAQLSNANVPLSERFMAVSPDFASVLLGQANLSPFDALTGSLAETRQALAQAIIGTYRGFTVVESSALDAGTAVLYHRSALVFANVTPAIPAGAADAATTTHDGVGLRHIRQYDTDVLSDASVVSTFAAGAVTDADRIVKLDTDNGS